MDNTRYFQSYHRYFWQWEEHGNVLAIPNGNTIAYRDYVVEVLTILSASAQSIPPLGSLLLVLIATNPENEASLVMLSTIAQEAPVAAAFTDKEILDKALSFLQMLSTVPERYKQGEHRLLLLHALFEQYHYRIGPARAKKVLAVQARRGWKDVQEKQTLPSSVARRDWRGIALLWKIFPTVDALVSRIADLPKVEEHALPIEEHLSTTGERTDIIDELMHNEKTFYVGSLVRHIWSGLSIPFRHALPSQQPLGGIADIANKGSFDKLLLSEFANDDIVLLSRLANNEALYFHRETPPTRSTVQRIVLVDISIKNWGTPKTIACALSVAIAHYPRSTMECSAFAVGTSYHPLSFENVDAVINSLHIVDACLHPEEGLKKFFREHPCTSNTEIFFISSEENANLAVLHSIQTMYRACKWYWLYTNAEGRVAFYQQYQHAKHIQTIQLPLHTLWSNPPRAKQSAQYRAHEQFPMLFPSALNAKKLLLLGNDDILQINAEKNLLRLSHSNAQAHRKGWELLECPLQRIFDEAEAGTLASGEHLLLLFNVGQREITLYNITTGEKRNLSFRSWRSSPYKQFLFHEGDFYYLSPYEYWIIPTDGTEIVHKREQVSEHLMQAYKQREDTVQKLRLTISNTTGILKNIRHVFINQMGNLVFNTHELTVNSNNVIRLERSVSLQRTYVTTVDSSNNVFTFADGSLVTVHRSGMLVLRSSNERIPTIYIASVVDSSLGVSTVNTFAGNPYYYNSDAEYAVEITTTTAFWKRYIQPFITQITAHGAHR